MTLVGNKIIFGAGVSATVGIITASKLAVQSADYNDGGSEAQLRNENGDVTAVAFYGDEETLSITCIPYDDDSLIEAAANFNLPQRGTKCTIVATDVEGSTDQIGGSNWIYVNGTKRIRNDGVAEMSVTLKRYSNIT